MRPEDQTEFTKLLVGSMAVYDHKITAQIAELYFSALGLYSLEQVRDALSRHMQDQSAGKFYPKPADIIGQILDQRANDGRPGKDQAWSIALCSLDDNETVLLTPEILAALDTARPLLEMRDKVAARMAFVEVYEKLVARNRAEGRPVQVTISLGDDKARRQLAIEDGLRRGMLTQAQAEPHLIRIAHETQPVTAEGSAIAGLLAAPERSKPLTNEERQKRLQEVRSQIGKGARVLLAEKSMAEALGRKADTERRKAEVLAKIEGKTPTHIIRDEVE